MNPKQEYKKIQRIFLYSANFQLLLGASFNVNFKSIVEYDCARVKLLTKKGLLSICGERLEILYYDEEEIAVRGKICNIEL